jgi:hypothetical protein
MKFTIVKKPPIIFAKILFITVLLSGCDRSLEFEIPQIEPTPMESYSKFGSESNGQNIIRNDNVELGNDQPHYWRSCIVGYNDYQIYRTVEYYCSPGHSLKISVDKVWHTDSFAYWQQPIPYDTSFQNDFILTAHLKLKNVVGQGIACAVRGDNTRNPSGMAEAFYTTQYKIPIIGTEDWKDYNLIVTDIPETIKCLTVYLLFLPQTTGTVYFDDITLKALDTL